MTDPVGLIAIIDKRKCIMYIYWRVIEELKFLGETWYFHDPTLKRHFDEWVRKRSDRINIPLEDEPPTMEPLFEYKGILTSLN